MNNKLNKKLKVLFVASEVAPIAKVGGLADVVGALPKALKKLDVDVKIIIPKYGMIDEKKYPMKKIASEIKIPFYNQEELINIYSCFLPTHPESLTINSENKCGNKNFSTHKNLCFNTGRRGLPETQIEIYLIENLKYLSQDGVYLTVDASSSGEINECQRFIFFTKCVAEIFLPLTFFRKKVRGSSQQQATEYSRKCGINWQPNIFHCHDWSTGFLPLLIKMQVKNQKTLFTIHNFAYQGKYNPQEIFKMLNLKETDWPTLKERTKNQFEDLNAVQQAILNANLINTVSPTYAQEILTKEFGEGLENDLKKRKNDLFGILNGIDTTFFNPMTDLNLKKNYGLEMTNEKLLKNKEENKNYLQKICNLKVNSKIPLVGIISRLAEQKGFDLIIETFEKLMKLNLQFVLLGAGDLEIEKKLTELSLKYLDKFSCNFKFDAKLAQQIYAGSDIFLMPSHFEPCGLGQLIAMRYGTTSIVRKTGGLTDTVESYNPPAGGYKTGIGFVFEKYEAKEMLNSIKEALKIYENKKEWQKIIFHNMKQNFSWETSAKKYLKLYQKLLKI